MGKHTYFSSSSSESDSESQPTIIVEQKGSLSSSSSEEDDEKDVCKKDVDSDSDSDSDSESEDQHEQQPQEAELSEASKEEEEEVENKKKMRKTRISDADFGKQYPCLAGALKENLFKAKYPKLNREAVRLLDSDRLQEMDKQWESFFIKDAEYKTFKMAIICRQVQLFLDAAKRQ